MRKSLGIMVVLVLCSSTSAYGDVFAPVWPPPGGVTYNFSVPSNIGSPGGMTIYFNNLNPAAYGQLVWGPNGIANITDKYHQAGFTGYMNYGGIVAPGVHQWVSSVPLFTCSDNPQVGCFSQFTFLYAQVQPLDGSNAFQPNGLPAISSLAFPGVNPIGGPEYVWGILGTSFQVHLQYKIGGWGGVALDTWYNGLDTCLAGDCLVSNFNGGFWATPAAQPGVPEPGSLVLLGTGLLGLGRVIRRRL